MFAAIRPLVLTMVFCGASVFTSCSNDDNPAEPDLGLAGKIIGKWITAESNGKSLPTNEKVVLDFVSTTEAYESLSFQEANRPSTPWNDRQKDIVRFEKLEVDYSTKILGQAKRQSRASEVIASLEVKDYRR